MFKSVYCFCNSESSFVFRNQIYIIPIVTNYSLYWLLIQSHLSIFELCYPFRFKVVSLSFYWCTISDVIRLWLIRVLNFILYWVYMDLVLINLGTHQSIMIYFIWSFCHLSLGFRILTNIYLFHNVKLFGVFVKQKIHIKGFIVNLVHMKQTYCEPDIWYVNQYSKY